MVYKHSERLRSDTICLGSQWLVCMEYRSIGPQDNLRKLTSITLENSYCLKIITPDPRKGSSVSPVDMIRRGSLVFPEDLSKWGVPWSSCWLVWLVYLAQPPASKELTTPQPWEKTSKSPEFTSFGFYTVTHICVMYWLTFVTWVEPGGLFE